MTEQLAHLTWLATRKPWMTDLAHLEWQRQAKRTAEEWELNHPGLTAALTQAMSTQSSPSAAAATANSPITPK